MIKVPLDPEVSFTIESAPKLSKDFTAVIRGYERIKPIKRTRKRQIRHAALMDHTSYEWSQWWHKTARESRGGGSNEQTTKKTPRFGT